MEWSFALASQRSWKSGGLAGICWQEAKFMTLRVQSLHEVHGSHVRNLHKDMTASAACMCETHLMAQKSVLHPDTFVDTFVGYLS